MEIDSFLASPRWDILKIISEYPSSPIKIAEETKTTVSFVSQQLKLLEAAGLVTKTKTGAFEKGKPRTLFSISKDFLYLIILTNGFAKKKLIKLSDYQKITLRIWLIEDKGLRISLEEFLFKIKNYIEDIDAIFLDKEENSKITLFTKNKKINSFLESFVKKLKPKIKLNIFSEISPDFDSKKYNILHIIPAFLEKKIELKGGNLNHEKTIF